MSSVPARRRPYVLIPLVLALAGCGGGDSTSPPPPPPPAIASVTIEADAKNVPVGGTLQLRAVVKDVQGATRNDAVTWTALDDAIASVSTTGLASGKIGGVARMRAAVGAVTDEASLSVAKVFSPGTPVDVTADGTGIAHVYTPSFGGLHFRLQVRNNDGGGLGGALVGYSEQDGKAAFAVDGPDGTWAPGVLWGTPDSLLLRVPGTAPQAARAAGLSVAVAALELKLGRLTELGIPGNPNAYHLAKLFAHLGADNGACVSLLDAAPILKTRGNREVALAFRGPGVSTSSLVSASVLRREALTESNGSVAEQLRAIGVAKWGLPSGTTVSERVKLRNDFLDAAKVGQQFRRFWDVVVLVTNDPACAPAVAQLQFDTQPTNVVAGAAIAPAVKVSLRDAGGVTIPSATNPVTVAFGQNTTGAVLSGTLTRTPVNGVATFDDLKVDKAGTYTLMVSAAGKNATSSTFVVSPAPAPSQGKLGVGQSHACGITPAGSTWCWGGGTPGVNGDGGANNSPFVPSQVVGGHSFTMVSGGSQHTCALTTAGAVYCWGLANGMLGNGTTDFSRTPLPVSGGHTFKWVGAGGTHTCAVRTDGAAFCWGSNGSSQIGDGVATTTARLTPSPVTGGHTFSSIVGGGTHTCALTPAGAAYCWGANNFGQLGDGSTTNRATPTPVAGGVVFASLTLLNSTTCGLTAGGQAWCWGSNSDGQIGDNSTTNRMVPTQVSGGLTFSLLTAGSNNTCGIVAVTGAAFCWGINTGGQLGIGTTGADQLTPLAVGGGHTFRDLVAGGLFACGIANDNKVYCWGVNNFGQLGNATNQTSLLPGPIAGTLVF